MKAQEISIKNGIKTPHSRLGPNQCLVMVNLLIKKQSLSTDDLKYRIDLFKNRAKEFIY